MPDRTASSSGASPARSRPPPSTTSRVVVEQGQPADGRDGHRDDLGGEPQDDLAGDLVALPRGVEQQRRELHQPVLGQLADVQGDRHGQRVGQAEVAPGTAGLEQGRPASPVLGPHRRRERREADVVPAAPVAGDRAQRREADDRTVPADPHRVDPRAADDGDAPAAVGAGSQQGEGVVQDDGRARPSRGRRRRPAAAPPRTAGPRRRGRTRPPAGAPIRRPERRSERRRTAAARACRTRRSSTSMAPSSPWWIGRSSGPAPAPRPGP